MECLMDHIVLNVYDVDRMIAFYSDVIDLKPERMDEYRAGKVPFASVRLNKDTIIDMFPEKMWQKDGSLEKGHENMNHFCIVLLKDAWEKLRRRLQVRSVAIEEGPVPRWGAHGTGISIYFRDPEENLVEARYYETSDDSKNRLLGS